MESFVQDIKFGLRIFLKKPLFTSLAVFVLALGIGAATAIFTVINAVLINPLPFSDSEKLVEVSASSEENSTFPSSYPNFVDWRSQNQVFERMAAYNTQNFFLGGSAEITRVKGSSVSPDVFPLLGVNAYLGRIFTEEDDKPNGG
ncbi:MAG: ABC transporter permease, partial [Blastocatellia bacterium]|nr:ABC transporter permease [Blastocatellia bacterium]